MVVIPALLGSVEDATALLRQIELHYLANSQRNLYFALLTDFSDAPEKQMPEDASLLEAAQNGLKKLNEKYAHTDREPFYLFHRERLWNESENCCFI